MISVYLNSLNNMLFQNNPVAVIWRLTIRRARAAYNWPKNMRSVKQKQMTLRRRLNNVENRINYSQTAPTRHRFDVER